MLERPLANAIYPPHISFHMIMQLILHVDRSLPQQFQLCLLLPSSPTRAVRQECSQRDGIALEREVEGDIERHAEDARGGDVELCNDVSMLALFGAHNSYGAGPLIGRLKAVRGVDKREGKWS